MEAITQKHETMTMEQSTAQSIVQGWIREVMLVTDVGNNTLVDRKPERQDMFFLTKPA